MINAWSYFYPKSDEFSYWSEICRFLCYWLAAQIGGEWLYTYTYYWLYICTVNCTNWKYTGINISGWIRGKYIWQPWRSIRQATVWSFFRHGKIYTLKSTKMLTPIHLYPIWIRVILYDPQTKKTASYSNYFFYFKILPAYTQGMCDLNDPYPSENKNKTKCEGSYNKISRFEKNMRKSEQDFNSHIFNSFNELVSK